MRLRKLTQSLGLAALLCLSAVASSFAFNTMLVGDYQCDGVVDVNDLTTLDQFFQWQPASGPYYAPPCSVSPDSDCTVDDITFLQFILEFVPQLYPFSGPNFVDFSMMGCGGACTGTVSSPVTISGNPIALNIVGNPGLDGPGIEFGQDAGGMPQALCGYVAGTDYEANLQVLNDTTGGASVPAMAGVGAGAVNGDGIGSLSFDATCGPTAGGFDVRIYFEYLDYTTGLILEYGGPGGPQVIDETIVHVTCGGGGPVCGNGAIEGGEGCDAGPLNGTTTCGCQLTCQYANTSTTCGGAPTTCDTQDYCNGAGACTANYAAVNTACGGSAAACDALDTCDGAGTCVDRVDPNGTVCLAGTLPCNPDDTCDGTAKTCAAVYANTSTTCGGAPTTCDTQDYCDGAGACTANYAANGTSCADGLTCNGAETCNGSGTCSAGTPLSCPDNGLFCDGTESCTEPAGCTSSGMPCVVPTPVCNETLDICEAPTCGGSCTVLADCTAKPECADLGACTYVDCQGYAAGGEQITEATTSWTASAGWTQPYATANANLGNALESPASAATQTRSITTQSASALFTVWVAAGEAPGGAGNPTLTVTVDATTLPVLTLSAGNNNFAWYNAGTVTLAAGAHNLTFSCGNTAAGRRCSLDGLLLTTLGTNPTSAAGFTPYGTANWDAAALDSYSVASAGTCSNSVPELVGTACGGSATGCDALDTCDGAGACVDRVDALGTVCLAAAGACDADDVCDGSTKVCAPLYAAVNTACGGSAVACDALDTCDGAGTCVDRIDPLGTVCLTGTGTCDPDDTCDGAAKTCAAVFANTSTTCGAAPTTCDTQDYCNGAGACTANYAAASTPCPDALYCNGAETCNGTGTCSAGANPCAGHNVGPACNDSCNETADNCTGSDAAGGACTGNGTGACTGADTCNGSGVCNNNDLANGTACGGSAAACDALDTCNAGVCVDNVDPLNTVCLAGTLPCDPNDVCDGVAKTCTAVLANTSTTCGAAPTTCDTQDYCNGAGACTANYAAVSTPCPDALYCNGAETCNGTGTCNASTNPCAGHNVGPLCNDSCNETADNCTANDVAGGACTGNGTGACTNADTCNGSGACNNNDLANGTACGGSAAACDALDTCNAGVCVDNVDPLNTVCLAGTLPCDPNDVCDGVAKTCTAVFANTSTTCGAAPTTCDTQDFCNGAGACTANYAAASTPCPDGTACNGAETCNGTGTCSAGTPVNCNDSNACTGPDTCTEPAGTCSNPALPANCGDGNKCPVEICDGSAGAPPADGCTVGNPCNVGCTACGAALGTCTEVRNTQGKKLNMGNTNDDLCVDVLLAGGATLSNVCVPGPCVTSSPSAGVTRVCATLAGQLACAKNITSSVTSTCVGGTGGPFTATGPVNIQMVADANGGVGDGYMKGTVTACAVDRDTLAKLGGVQVQVGQTYSAALACTTAAGTGCCTITNAALDNVATPLSVTFARVGYPYTTIDKADSRTVVGRMMMGNTRKKVDTGLATIGDNGSIIYGTIAVASFNTIHNYVQRHGAPAGTLPNPARGALVLGSPKDINIANIDLDILLGPSVPRNLSIGGITTALPMPGNLVSPDLMAGATRWDFGLLGTGPMILMAAAASLSIEPLDLGGMVGGTASFDLSAFNIAIVGLDLLTLTVTAAHTATATMINTDTTLRLYQNATARTFDFAKGIAYGKTWNNANYWQTWENGGSLAFTQRHRLIIRDTQGGVSPQVLPGAPDQVSGVVVDPDTVLYGTYCTNSVNNTYVNCYLGGEHNGFLDREYNGRGGNFEGLFIGYYYLQGGTFNNFIVPYTLALAAWVECGANGYNVTHNAVGAICNANHPGGKPTAAGETDIRTRTGATSLQVGSAGAFLKLEPRGAGIFDPNASEQGAAGYYTLGVDATAVTYAIAYPTNPQNAPASASPPDALGCAIRPVASQPACCATNNCAVEPYDIDARTVTYTTTAATNKAPFYTMRLGAGGSALNIADATIADTTQEGTCSTTTTTACAADSECVAPQVCNRPNLEFGDIWNIYTPGGSGATVQIPDITGMAACTDGLTGACDFRHIFGDTVSDGSGIHNPAGAPAGTWPVELSLTYIGQGGIGLSTCYNWNGWSFANIDQSEFFSANTSTVMWENVP